MKGDKDSDKVTMRDIVDGTPKGQKAVDKALKRSIEAQNTMSAKARGSDTPEEILGILVKDIMYALALKLDTTVAVMPGKAMDVAKTALDHHYAREFLDMIDGLEIDEGEVFTINPGKPSGFRRKKIVWSDKLRQSIRKRYLEEEDG